MTFLFDTLFGSSKKIYRGEFNRALSKISDLSSEEKRYLNDVFKNDLIDGLSEYELRQKIEQLRHKPDDCLDYWEIEQVKRKLMGELGK